MKLILKFFILLSFICFSNNINWKYQKGEEVKILSEKKYPLRIYVFTDISACQVCNYSLTSLNDTYSDNSNVELRVIFSSITQNDAENIRDENNWDFDVIGDIHNMYYQYYEVPITPFILLLNNSGKILDFTKLGDKSLHLKQINQYLKNELDNYNNLRNKYLTELKRIKVLKKDSTPIISDLFYRNALYDSKRNIFFYRKYTTVPVYIIDSTGMTNKIINYDNYLNLKGWRAWNPLSWAYKDSILALHNEYKRFIPIMQLYDVEKDSIVFEIEIHPKKIDSILSGSSFSNVFTKKDIIFQHYDKNYSSTDIFTMNGINTIFLYDFNGNLIKNFGKPDSIYLKHPLSSWFSEYSAMANDSIFVTNQEFSNILHYWDFEGNNIKNVELDFGDNFRHIDSAAVKFVINPNIINFKNRISRNRLLLYDEIKKRSMICYFNETVPEGVEDAFFSPEIKWERFLVISDDNGNRLTEKEIEVHKSCIPFYYHNNIIYATELNEKRQLEIVKYKLNL